jgi:nucleoside diphosphate kinase
MEEDTVIETGTPVVANSFSEDITRYFKIFLETGLRDGLLPARHVSGQRLHGLQTSLLLEKYPQLHKNLYKNIISGFSQETFVISQNKYVTHTDDRASDILARSTESLTDEQVEALTRSFAHVIEKYKLQYAENQDVYTKEVARALREIIASELLVPMLRSARTGVSDERGATMQVQQGATQRLFGTFELAFQAIATKFYIEAQSFETLHKALHAVLPVDAVKRTLREYLDEFATSDAYQDVYQLHRNNQALGTTDLYAYFGEISFQGTAFPLFYSAVQSTHAYPSVTFAFENRICVNTKALDFVLQQYNRAMGVEAVFSEDIEKIITIDGRKRKDVIGKLQRIITVIVEAFDMDKALQLDSPSPQLAGNAGVTLANTLRIVVFDASNEAIVSDYEALLASNTKARAAFSEFARSYIMDTPTRYVQEVAEEWAAKPITEKLIGDNPLPLNDEQKQALLALNKPDCNVLVVDGPPGTGKSHFISSVVAQSFADGFSTLVLSDTPAALDSVQNTVTELLAEVRDKNAFHNPLLRLGKTDDELLEELQSQFVQKLQAYHQNYAKLQGEMRSAKNHKIQEAAETLTMLVQNAENVNLHEVEQTVNNETKFSDRDWIQDEPVEEITSDLQQLHQAIQYIRKSEANYLLPYIESSQQKAIAEFLDIVQEYEKANKSVHERLPDFIVRYRKLLPEQKSKLQSALSYIHSNYRQYTKTLINDPITTRLDITDNSDYRTIAGKQVLLEKLVDVAGDAKRYLSHDKKRNEQLLLELISYETPPEEIIAALNNYIDQVNTLKSKIFGFSGRTLVVENLTRQLKKTVPGFSLSEPEKRLDDLQLMVDLVEFTIEQLAQLGLELDYWKEVLHIVKQDKAHIKELQKIVANLVVPADFEFMANHRIYEADNLLANISLLQHANELNGVFRTNPNLATLFGIKSIGQVLAKPQVFSGRFNKLSTDLDDVKQLDECKRIIKQFLKTYPAAARRLGVNYSNGNLDIIDDTFAESKQEDVKEYLAFKKKEQDITAYFNEMVSDGYTKTIGDLSQIAATQLSHTVDTKLMKYVETQAENFAAIRAALKSKKQIDSALFSGLLQAFPAILADIRDYANYVPLKKGLFDVVIIDEASRVSVAEAMPALLRAKKIIVLGDNKQFGNMQATSVNGSLNAMFRNKIATALARSLQDIPADTKNVYLAKALDNFDVTKSVLDFCRPIANAEIAFSKYFRSPPELISYVNKTFYADTLKRLKARALPLKESLKFDVISPEDFDAQGVHSNDAEAKHILAALLDMKENGYTGTIGIITPYYEQAALIQKHLDESVVNDWFEKRQLKVMTFDTAQGEERDYIFYSMVSDESQAAQYVFPVAGDVKGNDAPQHRLTVGFSRARSIVHFVLSKPVDTYSDETKNTLKHYQQLMGMGTPKKSATTTDILLAAESLLPQYFYATKFYKKYTDRARLVTQFSLGDLLKPLAPRYRHPAYKVDFMIALDDERIIITYDEFKENFMSGDKNVRDSYLTANEIYDQKQLESYGYKFLRLNKFNLGAKPIETLDKLLSSAVRKSSWPRDNGFLK